VDWDVQGLFRRHAGEISHSLRRRGLSEDTAADLTQDTFVRLITVKSVPQANNPRAYLFQIARNLLFDHFRREKSSPIHPAPEEIILSVMDPSPSAETIVYDKQRLEISERALSELPERTRLAFELHRVEGLTIAETGERIGLSTTQTWTLVRDAYRHVRERLQGI
jgi:RNA polymerase sigma factor (sigma-70 family)